ncbi:MAG TPA: hypothetical protein VMV79_00705, partial [Alphaproteobacteria bacterium]|nr:hypothetical protein [Alphaproteobacteria bacterium]
MDEAVDRYLLALARHPFVRRIEVDSEHFVADFEAQWPVDPGWEDEALELGGLIADLAYPMLDRVKARYGVLTVWVGAALKPPPAPGNETALRAAIDATQGILRYRLTEPHNADDEESVVEAAAEAEMETPIAAGLILMCQPLGSNYHRQRSAVGHWVHQHGNLFGWTQLALNRLYDLEAEKRAVQEAEAAREAEEIRWLRARFRRLMRQRQKEAETAFWEEESEFTARSRRAGIAMVAPQAGGGPSVRPPAVPGIPMPEKMAEAARAAQPPALALPPNLRALEERLLAVAAAPRFSPEFRTLAHELAQELRAFYPTALVEEAAFAETARMPWVRHEETVAPAVILMPIAGPTPSAPAALARAGAAPAKTAPSEGAVREAEAVLPTGPAPTPALPPTAAKPEARAILATPPTQAAATPAQTPTAGVAPSVPQPGVREIPAAAGEAVARAEAVQPAGVVPTEAAVRVGGAPSTTGPAPTAPTEVVSSTRTIAAQAAVPTRAAGAPPEKERLGPTVAPRPAAPGTRPETVVEVIAPTPTVGTAPPPTGVREIPAAAGPTPAAPTARMETAAPTPAIEVRAEFAAPSAPGPHVAEAGPTAAPVMPAASRPAGTPTGGTASPVTPAASPPTAAPIALQPAAKPAAAVPAPPAPTAPVAPAMPAAPA